LRAAVPDGLGALSTARSSQVTVGRVFVRRKTAPAAAAGPGLPHPDL
jgi:hypothetical protein